MAISPKPAPARNADCPRDHEPNAGGHSVNAVTNAGRGFRRDYPPRCIRKREAPELIALGRARMHRDPGQ